MRRSELRVTRREYTAVGMTPRLNNSPPGLPVVAAVGGPEGNYSLLRAARVSERGRQSPFAHPQATGSHSAAVPGSGDPAHRHRSTSIDASQRLQVPVPVGNSKLLKARYDETHETARSRFLLPPGEAPCRAAGILRSTHPIPERVGAVLSGRLSATSFDAGAETKNPRLACWPPRVRECY